jgi:hypothetical protein
MITRETGDEAGVERGLEVRDKIDKYQQRKTGGGRRDTQER